MGSTSSCSTSSRPPDAAPRRRSGVATAARGATACARPRETSRTTGPTLALRSLRPPRFSPAPRRDPRLARRRADRSFEQLDYGAGMLAAYFGVLEQRDPVRASGGSQLREGAEHRAHDLRLAEHRRGENVQARAPVEQVERDVAPPHVRSRAETRLPVASAPVPGGVHERGLLLEELADGVEIAMRVADEALHELRIQRRWAVA